MARIHITGNAGSGKTTLAARVGAALDLPVFGLDQVVWQPGWKKSSEEFRAQKIAELLSEPEWVIEGVAKPIRDAAEVIVFLDVPRRVSFLRCAKRNWRYLFRSRPELPDDCPEIRILPRLVKIIWRFPTLMRPGILADLERTDATVYHVRSRSELEAALTKLGVA